MKKLVVLFLLLPGLSFSATITEKELIGEWEWLGNAFSKSQTLTDLIRTGPSIKRFSKGGKYEYVSVTGNNSRGKPVAGTWRLEGDVLIITRPDNGTFKNRILSHKNGVLETQDDILEAYSYMKKISN